MEPTALSLNQRQYVEAVIAALPHLADAVAAIPLDCQVKAFEAAERSYLRTFRQLGLPGPETWASSIMRRLRRRVREAGLTEQDKLKKLYEQLSANECLETAPGHSFNINDTALSGEQKNIGKEGEFDKLKLHADDEIWQEHKSIGGGGEFDNLKLHQQLSADDEVGQEQKNVGRKGHELHEQLSADEQIGQARSFHTYDTASSGEQKDVGRELHEELSADEQAAQAHSFEIHDTASSGEQNDVGRELHEELSADEQTAHSSEIPGAASSGEQEDVGRKGEFDKLNLHEQLSADEQIGRADSIDINDAASAAEQKNVGREGAKKAAVALRMTKVLINIDEIFDGGRRVGVENVYMRKR
jgi:hypothetical protein